MFFWLKWSKLNKCEFLFLVGLGGFLYGVSLIFYPAAWILGGIILAGIAFIRAK